MRVTFKTPPPDLDTVGNSETVTSQTTLEKLQAWGTRATVPCKREYLRGIEAREERQDIALNYAELYIRYNPNAMPETTDAAICDGKIYGIIAVGKIGSRNKLVKVSVREVR